MPSSALTTVARFPTSPSVHRKIRKVRSLRQAVDGLTRQRDALLDTETQFRGVVEQNIAGVFILTERGEIAYLNERFAQLCGFSAAEVYGRPFLDFVAPEDRTRAMAAFEASMRGHSRQLEFTLLGKGGRTIDVLAHGARATYQMRPALVGVALDITERRQYERTERAATNRLREVMESTVAVIAATLEARDPYTAGHQRRVAQLASAIARTLGCQEETIRGVHFGALIHDVGKIQIPAELLSKPTKLTVLESKLIETHAEAGFEILKGIEFPWPVAQMVLQHHERLDGSGYPYGLTGASILMESRILAVADVVEAMSSHRPYRPSRGVDVALAEIEAGRGTLYDSDAVDACLLLFRERHFAFSW